MPFYVWLFIAAFLLYTGAIWSHWSKRNTSTTPSGMMITAFSMALALDIVASIIGCIQHAEGWVWDFHTITGTASLIGMSLHWTAMYWIFDKTATREGPKRLFNKTAPTVWVIWSASFFTGFMY